MTQFFFTEAAETARRYEGQESNRLTQIMERKREQDNELSSESARDRQRSRSRQRGQERHSASQAERGERGYQNLGTTDESESDSDDGSEYVPSPSSSDSENCSLYEDPMWLSDFPKDTEIQVNRINTNFAQKVDELEGDTADLEHETLQLAKMSKLLMAIECGTAVYKGKSLDEIDFELEVALSNKHNQGRTSERIMVEASPRQEQDELSRSQKQRPDPDDPSDADQDSDELSRSQKQKPDPDDPSDADQDSDEGPGTHTKAKVKRSSKAERNGSTVQKKTQRRPWSNLEKKAVWRQLGNCITLMKVPGKDKCIECIDAEPALQSRHWRDIKNHVHNTIETRKKKLSRS